MADARDLVPILNVDDRNELEALAGIDPVEALIQSLDGADEAFTARVDGKPMCMWGIGPADTMGWTGVPWMLGSDLVQQHSMVFLRQSREIVRRWASVYPVLRNCVDARHERSIRWLRWLGFTIYPAKPMGVAGLPFHLFEMRA